MLGLDRPDRRLGAVVRHLAHPSPAWRPHELAGGGGGGDGLAAGPGAGVGGAGAAGTAASGAGAGPERIIDCHTHFWDTRRPEHSWPPPGNPLLYRVQLPEQCRAVAPPKVTGTVVVEAVYSMEDNQWLLDMSETDTFIV
eukprot:COSAG04_NODE_11382_length_712_cov_1.171289_2_plen_139_part_01